MYQNNLINNPYIKNRLFDLLKKYENKDLSMLILHNIRICKSKLQNNLIETKKEIMTTLFPSSKEKISIKTGKTSTLVTEVIKSHLYKEIKKEIEKIFFEYEGFSKKIYELSFKINKTIEDLSLKTNKTIEDSNLNINKTIEDSNLNINKIIEDSIFVVTSGDDSSSDLSGSEKTSSSNDDSKNSSDVSISVSTSDNKIMGNSTPVHIYNNDSDCNIDYSSDSSHNYSSDSSHNYSSDSSHNYSSNSCSSRDSTSDNDLNSSEEEKTSSTNENSTVSYSSSLEDMFKQVTEVNKTEFFNEKTPYREKK